MARTYPSSDYANPDRDGGTGEWQALRGELVALLDKVESHYQPAEPVHTEPEADELAQRVRHLRDQMDGTETASRRREALRTVKKTVDRFTHRDDHGFTEKADDLTAAIAEIRSRQGVQPKAQPAPRSEAPELRELGALVGGMSHRLERLEGELKTQRSDASHVRDVAGQVEQLTQVVELLAGAVGETGQVKRLEVQIAALGAIVEEAPKADLAAINARLDDVSTTVGKLAELQAQQMEREITRETQRSAERPEQIARIAPAVASIEESVRNVYDRIDAIERNVALSSGDFEKLTSEMAAFTKAMRDNDGKPDALGAQVEALVERLAGIEGGTADVAALKTEIGALRDAVVNGMEPRFLRLENKIDALADKVPVDSGAVESQLKALMARMDEAGAQLDGLERLYANSDKPDFEALAQKVADKTSDAMARKVPAPVAMFGPDSLKSIEDRLTGLIKSAGKTPDYDALADLIATKASEAVTKAAPGARGTDGGEIDALEKRMSALLNTAGKDTAERLARLEAILTGKSDLATEKAAVPAAPKPMATVEPAKTDDPFSDAMQPRRDIASKLDSILAGLDKSGRDAMPANPSDEAPLIDPGFKDVASKPIQRPVLPKDIGGEAKDDYHFDPGAAQLPPRPQSSLSAPAEDPFAAALAKPAAPEPVAPVSSTSTFVAAARRAQRAKQEQAEAPSGNSMIGRALARVRSRKDSKSEDASVPPVAVEPVAPVVEKPVEQKSRKPREAAVSAPVDAVADPAPQPGFLTRHRRPLLLAATLVAVSMLALNLVLQRMNAPAPAPQATAGTAAPDVPASARNNPPPSDDQSSLVPPRVIDLTDTTTTGSINPGEPMAFSRPNSAARPASAVRAIVDTSAAISTPAEPFALPPDGVGPLELREAAANGNAKAQFEVGAILGEGRAVTQDLAEAAVWYERSAAQGFAPAQYRLGNLYEVGSGVEKDLEQAKLWYQRGAEAGNRMAMHNLAALYAGGQLGDPEFELAAQWFEQAAGHGMTDSQFNLGMLYARGLGVEQSFEQSYKWFSLAAQNGDKDAAQARDDMAKSLSADAVSRIGEEVKAWRMAPVDLAANFAPIGTWSNEFDPGKAIAGRDVTLKVQQVLARLGFDVGSPDGVAGPKTAEAIKAFETATGMSAIGQINPRLLAVLGSQPV